MQSDSALIVVQFEKKTIADIDRKKKKEKNKLMKYISTAYCLVGTVNE